MWRSGERWTCLFAWKFNVIRSAVLTETALMTRFLSFSLKFPPAEVLALHYTDVRLDGPRKSKKTISCPAKNLLVSQEGPSSKERVNKSISSLIISIIV